MLPICVPRFCICKGVHIFCMYMHDLAIREQNKPPHTKKIKRDKHFYFEKPLERDSRTQRGFEQSRLKAE